MSRPETCRIAAAPADYQRYGIAKGEIVGPVQPRPGVLPPKHATSWRSTSSSASFDAEERASSTIHPARRTNIR